MWTGKEVGYKSTLAEIQQAKANDPAFQNMTANERKEAIDQLIAYREGKASNARVTNRGAARDVFVVMNMIEKEVRATRFARLPSALPLTTFTKKLLALHARTGTEYFAMATRSSVDDLIQPVWLGSPSAALFLADGPRTNAWDLLRQFEQSCCARKFSTSFITLTFDTNTQLDTQLVMEPKPWKFSEAGLSKIFNRDSVSFIL